MVRFQKDGKTMDVCSELQASVFLKNGWTEMETECVSAETDGIKAAETPKEIEAAEEATETSGEIEAAEEIQMTPEKQPPKRGRKPAAEK